MNFPNFFLTFKCMTEALGGKVSFENQKEREASSSSAFRRIRKVEGAQISKS
jgi:hypothetical protein